MRALLAFDTSAGSETAATLVAATKWPPGSNVRIVSVLEPASVGPVLAPPTTALAWLPEVEAQVTEYLESEVAKVVQRLKDDSIAASGVVLRGRAATVLVEEAARFQSDVIVAGSRGHGRIASLVLGSVSAELVDRAPCPVLVARRPTVERVLLATDGSSFATRAEQLVAEWPMFEDKQIRVLSVAEVLRPWHTGLAPTMYRAALDAYAKDLADAESTHATVATEAAGRLRAAGRKVDSKVRVGDAAVEIVNEAAAWPADVVVLGSQGLTGLSRFVLGSVARNVLQGSHSSVLIVRASAAEAA